MLVGCSTYGVIDNQPKSTVDHAGYSWHSWARGEHNDDLSIIISFSDGQSGGGIVGGADSIPAGGSGEIPRLWPG